MTTPSVRQLAAQIASLQRQVHAQATASQASLRSIEGGSIDVYDDDENLIGVIGLQRDGTVGAVVKSGAKPETPTDPDVQLIPGGAIVAWDGEFEDAQPINAIARVAVHMDETPGFTPDQDTEYAAIFGPSGGTVVIPLDDGAEWYVKLVAVSKGGVESDPSTEVLVAAIVAEIGFQQDSFVLAVDGAQTLDLTYEPLPNSEHLYCNGLYQREDVSWTAEGQVVSLLATPLPPRSGDKVVVEYAYREDGEIQVPWASGGWSVLQVPAADTTDRSSTGFDDSTWSTVAFPASNSLAAHPDTGFLPPSSTPWAATTSLWVRRHIAGVAGHAITVSIRIDDYLGGVWWNGTQVAAPEPSTTAYGERTIPIPNALVTDSNVLAVKCRDAAVGVRTYVDVQIQEA